MGDTDLGSGSVCFCQSKAFTLCQNNQCLQLCSFNSLFLQNKWTCSCGFCAHISIPACWCKVFSKWGPDRYFCIIPLLFWCKIWNGIGQGLKPPWQPGIPATEQQLLHGTEVLWSHKTWHLLPLQLEGDASGWAEQPLPLPLPLQQHQPAQSGCAGCADKACGLPVSRTDMVPILQGMQSSAEHSTREGVQLPLFLHQPSQRAPPPVRNMPRYPTGRHGGDLCSFLSSSLGSGSAAAPVQPTQPAPRLRSPGPRTSWQPGRERCRESSAKPSLWQPAGNAPSEGSDCSAPPRAKRSGLHTHPKQWTTLQGSWQISSLHTGSHWQHGLIEPRSGWRGPSWIFCSVFLTLEAWHLFTGKKNPRSSIFKALLLGWQRNAGQCSSAEVVQKESNCYSLSRWQQRELRG